MSFSGIQQCSRCHGLIARENFAVIDKPACVETLLLCEHCDCGVEAVFEKVDGDLRLAFHVDYQQRTEPVNFGRFIQRLRDAVGIAVSSYASGGVS